MLATPSRRSFALAVNLARRPGHLNPALVLARSLQSSAASESPAPPVLLDIKGSKATLTLNRPRTGNSLDTDLLTLLATHLDELRANDAVRTVVLTATGKYFCTGMNLGAKGTQGSSEEQFERASRMFRTVEEFPKPMIAVIQGSCYGGGNGLAMACDIRIALADITFTLSEVKIGFIPAIISRYIVREWGVAKAREAMLTARSIPVAELHAVSAVHYVEPDLTSAHSRVDEVVAQLVQGAPDAQADVKKLVNSAATESAESHWAVIKAFFVDMMRPNTEGKYGLECFQKKVKPDWGSLKVK